MKKFIILMSMGAYLFIGDSLLHSCPIAEDTKTDEASEAPDAIAAEKEEVSAINPPLAKTVAPDLDVAAEEASQE